ncbi:phosphodiester glycosidase family protein [Jeotgalibacillus proteolyticus]|uniref:SPOR domain-containing protein n=1 Tax=Jeotgalibacillus proteolyticus TaxID=2082395 RepID=A0A2S5G9J6_9BACL|nr:phosphodiester glycosidase family protein [Jeotgalibacillus proteolyticus]PPA69687.1 hypothetical protein C4B60_14180 [Jeotgalibacillus proteolyticus]
MQSTLPSGILSLILLFFLLSGCTGQSNPAPKEHKNDTTPFFSSDSFTTSDKILLTEGLTHHSISIPSSSDSAYFTVDIGFYTEKADAEAKKNELIDNNFDARVHHVVDSMPNDGKSVGYVVQSGELTERSLADELQKDLQDFGYTSAQITNTSYDGTKELAGPLEINILELDPTVFKGEIKSMLAHDSITGREKLTAMSARTDAIAGINGGYFVVEEEDGVPGTPAGLTILNGEIVSEAAGERTSLHFRESTVEIAAARTNIKLENQHGESKIVHGINRSPGLIRNCGGWHDDNLTEPKHDVTCTAEDELILFNRVFGDSTPEGNGVEAILDEEGIVTDVYQTRGNPIPDKGRVVSAIGEEAKWLKSHAKVGSAFFIHSAVFTNDLEMDRGEDMFTINGAPELLKNGVITVPAHKEGFRWSSEFYYYFALHRHPRTIVGIKENGNLLFVTVDGRNPERSIGLNFVESAQLLQALGAVDGINLDGGGSTSLVIDQQLVNSPSDESGERPIGDALIFSDNETTNLPQ